MHAPAEDVCWQGLYRTAGAAALVIAATSVLGVVTFLLWPPANGAAVTEWFVLFQRSWLEGMLGLDLLMLVSSISSIPVFVAGFVALRRTSPSLAALAAPLGLVAAATYFSSSRLFEMATLSGEYAAAASDADRMLLAAAGKSMLTTYLGSFAAADPGPWIYQGTAFNVSFALTATAGILLSAAMLRSPMFGRLTGSLGIAGNAAALGLFAPAVGIVLSLLSLPLLFVWYIRTALGFFRLAGS
jgi:hypothetical protein